jgi:hypothetical protein
MRKLGLATREKKTEFYGVLLQLRNIERNQQIKVN